MKKANISQLKAKLSQYVSYVKEGGTVYVVDRDLPVAELVPIGRRKAAPGAELDGFACELERQGVIRRGSGKLPADFLRRRLPKAKASVVGALLDERREGR